VQQLERAKAAGARPLIDARDLAAMFDMFDVTRTGRVSAGQAHAALATALGGALAAEAVEAAATAAAGARGGGNRAGSGRMGSAFPLAAAGATQDASSGGRQLTKEEFVACMGAVLIRAAPGCQLAALPGDEIVDSGGGGGGGRGGSDTGGGP
jgi:hypothetical protein